MVDGCFDHNVGLHYCGALNALTALLRCYGGNFVYAKSCIETEYSHRV